MLEVQNQIYIVSGVLGATSFLLLILTFVLFSSVSKLKRQVRRVEMQADDLKSQAYKQVKPEDLKSDKSSKKPNSGAPRPEVIVPVAASVPIAEPSYTSPPPVTPATSLIKGHGGSGNYGHGYDGTTSVTYEKERDLTAGGVRVLPVLPKSSDRDHQARKTAYHENDYPYE